MNKVLCFLLLILVLNACTPVTSNSLKKINTNDTEEQVKKILGNPYSKKAYYNKTYLVYYVYDDFFSIFVNLKKFPFFGFPPLLRTGDEYWIILEDNRVVAFGLSKNFGNNIPRALSTRGGTLEVLNF